MSDKDKSAAAVAGSEFYPPAESVAAEAQYLLAFRNGQQFDRQRVLHAAFNVGNWLNGRIPSGPGPEAAQAPRPGEQPAQDLDAGLKALAQSGQVPEGAEAALFGGVDWVTLLKQVLTEVALKVLAG